MMSALRFAATDNAALNNDQWNGLQNCGRCAMVSCADSRCADTTKFVVVQLLDRSPECKHGDLDLSPSVFTKLTGSTPSRYTVKWKFVDCPVPGNVNYCLKGGSNNYWTAIQLTNVGVTSLTINAKATKMLDGAYYYYYYYSTGSGTAVADLSSVMVSLTDINGATMKDVVSLSAGSCTKGSSQFASGGSSQSTPTLAPAASGPSSVGGKSETTSQDSSYTNGSSPNQTTEQTSSSSSNASSDEDTQQSAGSETQNAEQDSTSFSTSGSSSEDDATQTTEQGSSTADQAEPNQPESSQDTIVDGETETAEQDPATSSTGTANCAM